MNTKIIVGVVVGVVVVGGAFFMTMNNTGNQNISDCADICQKASQACPSLINESDCNSKCAKLSEETRKHLEEADDCEQITSRPDLIADLIIPEVAVPEPIDTVNDSDCDAACGNYIMQCLTLVPNATQQLFDEGYQSCLSECSKWNESKIDCMINAFDCESMTDVCGL